jgi:hypothetical protein
MATKKIKGKTLDITKNEIRYRIESPAGFDKENFRRKKISNGVSLLIGCPDGKFKKNKCKVGMKTQSLRFDRSVFTPTEAAIWVEKWEKKGKL